MTGFRTDKIGHGYLSSYLGLASIIGEDGRVLEIGVANGESLEMWQHLFPRGAVVGVDVNPKAQWPDGTHRVISDQADEELVHRIITASGITSFDLIVDDASHNNDLTRRTWELLWSMVRPGGWYVVEDWNHAGGLAYEFARDLLMCLSQNDPLVLYADVITYRDGMIVIRKSSAA
jgi:predicted O-methyltransferase YrrM